MLRKRFSDSIIFIHWKLSEASELVNIRSEAALSVNALDLSSESVVMFSHEPDLKGLHEYSIYLSGCDSTNAMDVGHVAGSIVALARFDAFIATTVSCSREDGNVKLEGHWKRLYHDTLLSLLPMTYSQLVVRIGFFAQDRCPSGREPYALSIGQSAFSHDESSQREATLEFYVSCLKRLRVAVSWPWLSQCLSI